MKKESTKLIVGIIVLIFTFFLLIFIKYKRESRPFANQDFNDNIEIINRMDNSRLDTIALALADKVYNYDSLTIVIQESHLKSNYYKFYGHTRKLSSGVYIIFLQDNLSCCKNKLVLSHEFVHINQYEIGDLKFRNGDYFWKNQVISLNLNYEDRPFEVEAFENQSKILHKLNKILY